MLFHFSSDSNLRIFSIFSLYFANHASQFLGFMGATEGLGIDGAIEKIKSTLMTSVTGSWEVWPIVHAIGFRFGPTEQRLLYINSVQIGYNMLLSVIGNK